MGGMPNLAPRVAFASAGAALLFLALLHGLSPEFDPSWRAVSEYALGDHGLVLSAMFVAWAVSSWALAVALRNTLGTVAGRIGLGLLVLSGLGEAMAAAFDVRHALHGVAAMIGIPSLPIAAMLITLSLVRSDGWREAKRPLLWTANLTWVSLVLMGAAFAVLMTTFSQSGAAMPADGVVTELPEGVIALIGWANRLLILAYCAWTMTVAAVAIRLRTR